MNKFNKPLGLKFCDKEVGTGWNRAFPDLRDHTEEHDNVKNVAKLLKLKTTESNSTKIPKSADWSDSCSPIENQGKIGSCTAHAAVGIIEYFQNRAFGKHVSGSKLFVYKTTRNLMGVSGDSGCSIRNTMGALATCGVAPENYWIYTDLDPEFDQEPTAFVYSLADNFEAFEYFCHDPNNGNYTHERVLTSVKNFLAAGIPSMFGFWGFPSFEQSDHPGHVPLPGADERAEWGHAVVAVGYDNDKEITNTWSNETTKGAFKIRNSWGEEWGDQGYGWIPYDYVRFGLAEDFWSLFDMKWIDTKQFGL